MNFQYAPGATPLDPDESAGLIPTHIATQGGLNAWEEANILQGARWDTLPAISCSDRLAEYVEVLAGVELAWRRDGRLLIPFHMDPAAERIEGHRLLWGRQGLALCFTHGVSPFLLNFAALTRSQ